MEAQTQITKGELLLEFQAKTITTTIKEISPSGVKLEVNDEGQVQGKYSAAHMETVGVLFKPDGTSEWEVKAIQSTGEGDFVTVVGKGTGRLVGPGKNEWEGEVSFMTMSPKLSWLNDTKGWVEGSGDAQARTIQAKVYTRK